MCLAAWDGQAAHSPAGETQTCQTWAVSQACVAAESPVLLATGGMPPLPPHPALSYSKHLTMWSVRQAHSALPTRTRDHLQGIRHLRAWIEVSLYSNEYFDVVI